MPRSGAAAAPAAEQQNGVAVIKNKLGASGGPDSDSEERSSDSGVPGPAGPRYPIDSVGNALKLLLMLRERPAIGVSEASRHLGVARSTAHRLLAELAHHGFVQQVPDTRTYTAGPALVEVGLAALRESDVRVTARPFIEELVRELDETVHLVTLRGAQVLFVDCVEGTRALRAASRTGTELPAHCTAGGKALLAEFPAEHVRELYPGKRLEQMTPNSIGTLPALLAELADVGERAYAVNHEESEAKLRAVAVAIKDARGHARAAITLAAPDHRLTPAMEAGIAASMRKTADRITQAIR